MTSNKSARRERGRRERRGRGEEREVRGRNHTPLSNKFSNHSKDSILVIVSRLHKSIESVCTKRGPRFISSQKNSTK